jgi:hypothetical protein
VNVDWDALNSQGIHPDDPILLHLESATLGDILNALFPASADGPLFRTERNTILITTRMEEPPLVRVYDVSDLVDASYAFHQLDPIRHVCINAMDVTADPPTRQECVWELAETICFAAQLEFDDQHVFDDRINAVGSCLIVTVRREKQDEVAASLARLRRDGAGRQSSKPR